MYREVNSMVLSRINVVVVMTQVNMSKTFITGRGQW
jgi:hypothetical protein